jgi:8-oxo-dGTP pyrophosphatase MutT (NUDIX family)
MKNILSFGLFESRDYWGSIGAGILPIAKTTGRILINYRSRWVNEGNTYGIWGGKLDNNNENLKDVAIREFVEETHYSGKIDLIPSYIFKDSDFKYHNFIGLIEDEFTPTLDWESEGFLWLTFDELIHLPDKHFGLIALLDNDKDKIEKISISFTNLKESKEFLQLSKRKLTNNEKNI